MTKNQNGLNEDQKRHAWLDSEFRQLAEQPVGRGSEAGELWARAEVVRRIESQPLVGSETVSSSIVWGPLAGALAALVVAAGLWLAFGSGMSPTDASDALVTTLGIVAGSLGVLGLAACSSLALLWNEL